MKNNKIKILLILMIIPIIGLIYSLKVNADTTGNLGALGSFPSSVSTSRQTCATTTIPVNGTFNSISYIADSATATNVGVAIYSDNGASRPGTKLASNTPTPDTMPVAKSWATSTISYTGTAGTIYWLCAWGGATGTSNFYYSSDSSFNYASGDTNAISWETWPSTFVTNSFVSSRKLGIYATYTPSGGEGGTTVQPPASMAIKGDVRINSNIIIPR